MDSLDDKAAARIDAFMERLRIYGNQMQGKFVKKLTHDIFELRVKQFDRIFRILFFYQPGMLMVVTSGFPKKYGADPTQRNCQGGAIEEPLDEVPKSVHRVSEGKGSHREGVGPMKRDRHA